MKITGKLEVFKNPRGYLTGILKSFNENKELKGKIFIDVEGLDLKDNRTYTIDVIEGFLNVRHVESLTKDFDKLIIKIVKHKFISVYPQQEGDDIDDGRTEESEESEDDLPF